MVGGGDGNRINLIAQLGKHFPVVLIGGGAGELFGPGVDLSVGVIDVAEADHFNVIMLGEVDRINPSLPSGSNVSGANLTVR